MAKGSGLSIDSDPIGLFLHQPIVLNSFPEDDNRNNNHSRNPKWKLGAMDATQLDRSAPSTIQFPLNLNCSHHQDSPPPSDDKRTVVNEMDFFAEKYHHNKAASTVADEKDSDCRPTALEFKVNVCDPYKFFNLVLPYYYHFLQ